MPQSSCNTFELQEHNINLNIQIGIAGNTDRRKGNYTNHRVKLSHSESSPQTSGVDVNDNLQAETLLLPVRNHEAGQAEFIDVLKERLRLAELGCLKLQELCQKYRLGWLEENYRATVLEEYAPPGIDTCSPHQITWETPSPIQSDDKDA
ncbi:hypothetical protein C8R48DRAFT_678920 [Suillus tomentosus]|nr:hypothetical protein C8R48DRAFT_678920 [Suillus tomentosus]